MDIPVLYIIIPCYNEEEVLPITSKMFLKEIHDLTEKNLISEKSRILFVNDGSKDKTWEIIKDLSGQDEHFLGIAQSRNRGHQNAVLAGLMDSMDKCDITISIDCDGQDDITAMEQMVKEYLNGAEVVFNHADYRLVSAKVLKEFAEFKEVNLFLRGMIPLVGFKSTSVYYDRSERIAGESHYPLKKMLALAFDGITSLSVKPLSMIVTMGILVSIISFCGAVWAVIAQLTGSTVAGWASMTCIICFLGGIQLICLGVIGTYIGKIYMEVKHRPKYIISERTEELKED